jgi:phosphopantetheine--protein transferase-like protein
VKVRTGTDIVRVASFKRSLENGRQTLLDRCFHIEEQEDDRPHHLAGIFAAKESVIKALALKPGSWLTVRVYNEASGRPVVELVDGGVDVSVESIDVSISHDGVYAVASCVAVLT